MIQRLIVLLLCLSAPGLARAISVADYPYLGAIVDRLVSEHGLDRDELVEVFSRVQLTPQVVEAIKRPAERLPWYRYRSFFINSGQIKNGVRFWEANDQALARAERETGVPQEIIAAVIGIETRYGATLGSHSVLESLTTLTLQYPRRQEFFGEQLEHFLLLTQEQNLDRFSIRGSYAGAIGIPQFMPTSYRQYAVDFSGDGKTDLVNQIDDAIGSVANYLRQFKWRAGDPVSVDLVVDDGVDKASLTGESRLDTTVGRLRQAGARLDEALPDDMKAGVVSLEGKAGNLYRVVFQNFYVLTRYNSSILYAMAVHELSTALKRDYHGS